MNSIRLDQCLWVRSGSTDQQPYFPPLVEALKRRGTEIMLLGGPEDSAGLKKIQDRVWRSDVHVVVDAMLSWELKLLRPIFEPRKNYSVAMMDWWTSASWIKEQATYLLFRNYNGIAARRGLAEFAQGRQPPWFTIPERFISLHVGAAALRGPALLATPLLQAAKTARNRRHPIGPGQMIYFPFTISEAQVPLQAGPPQYDFANVSSTLGCWIMRDSHAPARFNFANMYADRQRLVNLALRHENQPFKIFDLRRHRGHLPWKDYCDVLRRSRYALATGGLHQASLPKHLEHICLGTPILGENLPYEFPWLDQCLFPVDALGIEPSAYKAKLEEALEAQPALRQNCLNLRDTLLKMYSPDRILDLAQEQIDGQGIAGGYLKPAAQPALHSSPARAGGGSIQAAPYGH